jgi:hypothetical protein
VLINYNKFVDLNQKLSQEAKIMMHIKIFDLMLCITFKIFLFNYRSDKIMFKIYLKILKTKKIFHE